MLVEEMSMILKYEKNSDFRLVLIKKYDLVNDNISKNRNVIKMFSNVAVMYRNVCYACDISIVWRC